MMCFNCSTLSAATITERHNNLWNSIGALEEERVAFIKVWCLFMGSFAFMVIAAILQFVFFQLYNWKYHPFSKITIETKGKVFLLSKM